MFIPCGVSVFQVLHPVLLLNITSDGRLQHETRCVYARA